MFFSFFYNQFLTLDKINKKGDMRISSELGGSGTNWLMLGKGIDKFIQKGDIEVT